MELDYNKTVVVMNLSNANTGFKAIESTRDIVFPPFAKKTLKISEIMAQIYAGNICFVGEDGKGSHAIFYIDDKEVRINAGFESDSENSKQLIIDESIILDLFSKSKSIFKKSLSDIIKTENEKMLLQQMIKDNKISDYEKIKIASELLGINV